MYIVYNTQRVQTPHGFFEKVIKKFLNNIIKKVNNILANNANTSGLTPSRTVELEFQNYRIFVCLSGHDPDCNNHMKTVILSNVQLKLFVKLLEDEYVKALNEPDCGAAFYIQSIFILPHENTYSHIKIINDMGQIDNCETVLSLFQKQYNKELFNDQITDRQTDADFFKGIINSLHAGDIVRYITYNHDPESGNPSQGYEDFTEKCVGGTFRHECCSIHTKPNCEFINNLPATN